ncbi:MAG: SCO family protein, partial [Litorimonas sp.]
STGTADLGGPFTLVDETGATVTQAAFEGQPTLLYFGFSYCPDVCPTALQKLGAAQERMGAAADAVQFVMVTVDPERDTPEQLAVYVTNNGFPEGLRGFTGTEAQIEEIKTAYKVFSQKVPLDDSPMDYTVDHQDIIFLLGEDGLFKAFFTERNTPEDIAVRTRQYLANGV